MSGRDLTRREWCYFLAKLVSPSFPAEAQKALVDMLPALAHLPDNLFTEATIRAVAGAKRRQSVPAWDEIVDALHRYRLTFLPDPTLRLASRPNADLPPDRVQPSPEEVAVVTEMLTAWRREQLGLTQAREAAQPQGYAKPRMRSVVASGTELRDMRLARGAQVFPPKADQG